MSNTRKKIVSTNLFELRSQYELSQKELGQILGVTKKTISNYELEISNLPLESALILCKKYSCTLDWIYCHDSKNSASDSKGKPFEPFIVDIRDFISFSNNEVHITLPYYYYNYIKKRHEIEASPCSHSERLHNIAALESEYDKHNTNGYCRRISIPASEFLSYLQFDDQYALYANSESSQEKEPTKEQLEEATSFIKELLALSKFNTKKEK